MVTVTLTPTVLYTPKTLHLSDSLTLGRNHDDIVCTDENGFFPCETLSRRHAELFLGAKSKVYIKDLDSANGTFLNEVEVDSAVEVKSGDTLRLGIDLERVVTECKAVVVRASIAGGSAVTLTSVPTTDGAFPVKTLDLSERKVQVLGREHDGVVCAPDNGFFSSCVLSRAHAEIFLGEDGKVYLRDLESFNGTFVNDIKVAGERVEVKDGDIVRLGVDVVGPPMVQREYKAVVAKVEIAYGCDGLMVELEA